MPRADTNSGEFAVDGSAEPKRRDTNMDMSRDAIAQPEVPETVNYSREFRFASCSVTVRGVLWWGKPKVKVSAGATMTPDEALELAEAILAARRVAIETEVPDA